MRSHRPSLADVAREMGVRDERLLEAIGEVPRATFVPQGLVDLADEDVPVPIGHAQVTTQPTLVASMVEALCLRGTEVVLEVGSGYGYQTALLARLSRYVWGVERWPDLAATAEQNLWALGITNASIVVGDGTEGLAAHAPFDAVVVCAAFPRVPVPLVDQLVVGGRLVQPIGPAGADQVTSFVKAQSGRLEEVEVLIPARFVPLLGAHGHPIDETHGP